MMKKLSNIIFIAAVAALTVCGCQNDLEFDAPGNVISFNPTVGSIGTTQTTKASDLCSADGSVAIPLWLKVSEGISVRHAELDSASAPASPATKGELLNPDSNPGGTGTKLDKPLSNYATEIGGKFYVSGWNSTSGTAKRFVPSSGSGYAEISYNSSTSAWSTCTSDEWKGADSRTFYAYTNLPASGATVSNASATSQVLTYSAVPPTASAQKDILMGFCTGEGTPNTTDKSCTASVVFHHPLTAVKFVKGDFDGFSSIKFKAIYLSQIYKSGTATMTPTSIVAADPGSKFTWTSLSTEMQEASQESTTDLLNTTTGVIGEPFIIIPQNLESKPVTITVVVELDGVLNALTTTCDSGMWKAGYTNTYTLSREGYEWDYTFSLTWDEHLFNDNKDYSDSESNSIYSYRTRQDDSSVKEYVSWKIKSYKVGDGEEVTVDATSFDYSPAWIKASTSHQSSALWSDLSITAKAADKLAKGQHDYWINKDGRTDDLEWSPADWSDKGTLDLSKIDVYSDSPTNAHGMTTSNCYIVRHSGTYMLPLVYGNAMDGGSNNTHSYCTEDISSGTNRLSRFLNHKGTGITSPFIENNTGCIAKSCDILWQSDAAVVSGLEFTSNSPSSTGGFTKDNVRYLKFTVDKTTVEQSNALIAIRDNNGDIIWSWHIWITNDPEVINDAIKVTNYYGNEYLFFPIDNIGTISSAEYLPRPDIILTLQQDGPDAKTLKVLVRQMLFRSKTSSLMYEWGRKDPFLKNNTDYAGNTILTYVKDPESDVASGILNPMTWYGFDTKDGPYGEYEWATPLYANLWTGIKSDYGDNVFEQDATTIKTIYDPSPVGYQVPTIGAYSGFDTRVGRHYDFSHEKDCWNVVDTTFDNGYEFYTSLGTNHSVNTTGPTIIFHADGMRAGNGAAFNEDRGWYHASGLYESSDAAIFMVEDNEITTYNTASPSNGYSVRPIREK